ETVVGKRVCSYPSGVAEQFPNDPLLAKMGIEAYIGVPLFDSEGGPLGLIGIMNRSPLSDTGTIESMLQVFAARASAEIERSRAEEAVRQSEERHRTLMEQASDGIFIADIQGRYIDVNSSGCAMLGYSRDEILHMSVTDLLSIEDISTVPLLLEELRSGRIMIIERLLKRKDGKLLPVEISAKMLSGQRLQSIVRDITERRRSEERLKNSEKRFRALIENSSDAILLAGPNGTILYCGPSTGRIVGYSIDELLGRNGFEFMHPDDVERTMKMFSDLIQTPGSVAAAEYRFRQKDGSWRWMEGIGTNLLDEPGVNAVVANLRDITDRKLAEAQLERSREQLRNLSTRLQSMREEERTRIAREIHDELGQMLTVLKMEIALMMTKLPPGQKRLQGKMKSMSLLIDQTIQRVRKIATELRPGVLDDLGLPAAVEWQTQEFQSRTGIQCRLTLHPEEMTLDPARSTAIFRIFQETLTNVARHADADRVKIRLVEEGGRLVLEVADNGKGITESQISNSKSLGILGIRERALLWGGEVKIEGVPGKGTTVTAQIPLPEFSEDEDKERHVKDPHRG
ncbi:MAG TPA: PAS domain S-box protein, partial [Candidatus Manganitrophaceae bacterium]|nr:PAS domain S-box protein [Candidatus Manganitrophaceae bacterium]